MKHQRNKKQLDVLVQYSLHISALACVLLFMVVGTTYAQTAILPALGGSGGGQFIARCQQDQLLTGFELRTGDDVDAIRPICATAYGPATIGPLVTGAFSYGGDGGAPRQLLCPGDQPIVTGLAIGSEGVDTIIVNNVHLFCGLAAATQTVSDFPSAVFDGPTYKPSDPPLFFGVGGDYATTGNQMERCPAGLVAVGIAGKSGVWLDSVGLICGPPKIVINPNLGKALGRVNHPVPVIEPSDKIKQDNPSVLNPKAKSAPVAPLTAAELDDLAAKGELIANGDPLSSELFIREPEGPGRRGFDIGMAAAEGQTEPGPGKQRIHDALSPAEQQGFDVAVMFSLQRNKNANLATTGAAIAASDAEVSAARIAEDDVFYWLGFDIATGIFGDPAQGALGNTATGPGSMKIRDSLNGAGQRGFNASVALHLSRNYKL